MPDNRATGPDCTTHQTLCQIAPWTDWPDAHQTIDWTLRENVRAKMRVLVKRILRRHGCPPDKQEKAPQTVLEQAEVLCRDWAVA
ncbi:MAG: DUF3387 domain-containing protein [Planctomycetaceae bacterium]|nr:MAG: DUF3387 domain-containing protein [Planctomycetaceae bacterium]